MFIIFEFFLKKLKILKDVVTVTECQGLFDDKSIFTNKDGRVNLLQTGDY